MELDCWGGRYANARYASKVPARPSNTSFKVRVYAPDSDMCCDGRIAKTAALPSKTSLVVDVRATGWRAYTVRKVTATWSWKQGV